MSFTHVSLAQQLAQLHQPAPVDFDPEDAAVTNVDPEDTNEQPSNTGREHYLDVGSSALRKQHDNVSDPKYDGVRVSREQLEEDDDVSDTEDNPATSWEDDDADKGIEKSGEDGQEASDDQFRRNLPSHSLANVRPAQKTEDSLSSTLKRTREEERKKGKAVTRQLAMYNSLLDARIRLQKCVTSMNKLPDASKIPDYLFNSESRDAANKMLTESMSLADELFELQEMLMVSSESLTPPARKRRKLDNKSDVECDWEEQLQESSNHFAELESIFHSHLLITLQKWSNKVLAIAPSALLPSNRTKFSRNSMNQVKSAVQLVDEALLGRDALITRTRVWRGKGARLGRKTTDAEKRTPSDANPAEDTDVFDDTDFYQTLLRDIIDAHAGSASSGLDGLTEDWRAAQKQRKARKAVDTRASKGRKLRFEVHEKLQNFMAPAPLPGGVAWHEEQIDELFAGLLGRGFASAEKDGMQAESQPPMDLDVGQVLKGGFRVLG